MDYVIFIPIPASIHLAGGFDADPENCEGDTADGNISGAIGAEEAARRRGRGRRGGTMGEDQRAGLKKVRVLFRNKLLFLPLGIQHNQCPCRLFTLELERCKLCGRKLPSASISVPIIHGRALERYNLCVSVVTNYEEGTSATLCPRSQHSARIEIGLRPFCSFHRSSNLKKRQFKSTCVTRRYVAKCPSVPYAGVFFAG